MPDTNSTIIDDAIRSADNIENEWDALALEWPINSDSIVVDIGGYRGRWALQIARKYNSILYVYEPQYWAYNVCREILKSYMSFVYPYAIGTQNEYLPMSRFETDGCTFVDGYGPLGELRDAVQVLPENIDLMLINIEGYEYTLLPYLIDQGMLPKRLMVQWHRVAATDDQHEDLIRRIELTHTLLWDFGNVLMAWETR